MCARLVWIPGYHSFAIGCQFSLFSSLNRVWVEDHGTMDSTVIFPFLFTFITIFCTQRRCRVSGRKNVLRKLLRIPYRRLKAGFSVCSLCLFVAGVLSEMHEVRTFAPCKALIFYLTCLLFFSSLENYFGFRTTNVKGKTDHSVSLSGIKGFEHFLKASIQFCLCIRLIYELVSPG